MLCSFHCITSKTQQLRLSHDWECVITCLRWLPPDPSIARVRFSLCNFWVICGIFWDLWISCFSKTFQLMTLRPLTVFAEINFYMEACKGTSFWFDHSLQVYFLIVCIKAISLSFSLLSCPFDYHYGCLSFFFFF